MIYKLFTDGLPNGKVIAHLLVDVSKYTWSSACVCKNEEDAKTMMDKMIAKWFKDELEKFANQRQKALMYSNCYGHLEHQAYLHIKTITRCQHPHNTFYKVLEHESAINLLVPGKDSSQAIWIAIIGQILSYCKQQHTQTKAA